MLSSIERSGSDGSVSNVVSRSCLVTDDSAPVRRIARRLLTDMGFVVDEAENGKIALEKCQIQMPDVVLLDWNMPIMNGLEFLVELRQTDEGKVPIVIFCTTETDVNHIQKAIESGADEYLMKPFDKDSLGAKLSAVPPRK